MECAVENHEAINLCRIQYSSWRCAPIFMNRAVFVCMYIYGLRKNPSYLFVPLDDRQPPLNFSAIKSEFFISLNCSAHYCFNSYRIARVAGWTVRTALVLLPFHKSNEIWQTHIAQGVEASSSKYSSDFISKNSLSQNLTMYHIYKVAKWCWVFSKTL